ncbi:MAG: glycosyltransferase family 4 protein [Candidatus Kerfeldbacteria bacterium]|nr:glycosyltransferase family 4 protein [Candidatus Kerfeldbacteria bacterium]
MTKFKSWLLITNDYPPCFGGVARYYQGLATYLPGLTVLTNISSPLKEPNVIRRPLFNSWFWPRWLPLLWLVPFYKLVKGADLLAAGQILPIGTALWLINKVFGWPYAVVVHGYDLGLAKQTSRKRWLAKQVLAQASLVVANSEFTKSLAVSLGARPECTQVIYPCGDLKFDKISQTEIEEFKRHWKVSDSPVILTIARLVKRKNVAAVIRAVGELQSEFPNLRYLIIGDGPERDDLEKLAKATGAGIEFLGEVSDNDLMLWYKTCDLFVLTPRGDAVDIEGFGIVYLEAQAAGKAVVASAVGGVPEAVGSAGRLIKVEADLVMVLRELLNSPGLRKQLGISGLERVADQFNWPVQIKKLS